MHVESRCIARSAAAGNLAWRTDRVLWLAVALVACMTFSANAQLVIAHRGASYDAPENTLAAFNLAWEKGADGVEGDFYLTKDRRIVCIHDPSTKRTAGVELDVAGSTLAELRELEVGRYRGEQFAGERIPVIEDVLATVPTGKRIFIEVKCGPEIIPYLREVLAKSNLEPEQTCVISFNKDVVAASKKQIPHVKAHWITGFRKNPDTGSWEPSLEEVLRTAGEIHADGVDLNAHRQVMDAGFVKRLRDAGLEFHCWTVNDPAVAGRFQLLGVDSITTDRPDYIRQNLLTVGLCEHLQVHLRLDGDLEDASGHGRHGTLIATASEKGGTYCKAVFGQGLDLSAKDAAVAVGYRLPEAGAVSLWYYARDWYNYQTVLDNAVGPDDWEMWIYETGQIRFRTHHQSKAHIVHQFHPTGDVNEWHHLVVTWDRRDRSGQAIRLYVNGRLAASSDWQRSPWLEPGSTFYLAGGNNSKGNGIWDDVAVFDVALEPSDVKMIMDFGAGRVKKGSGLICAKHPKGRSGK